MSTQSSQPSLLELDRKYLRRHEVAHRLSVSTATIDNWVRAGKIPAIHHPVGRGRGRVVHFDWSAVCRALGVQLPQP